MTLSRRERKEDKKEGDEERGLEDVGRQRGEAYTTGAMDQ